MENLLRSKNLRVTPFRESVLSVFSKYDNAVSIHQIEQHLGEFDRVTLYRTMKSFQEKGLIHEIALPNQESKYALCEQTCSSQEHEHKHIHFSCSKCNEVSCNEITDYPKIKLPGYKINQVEISIKGICKNCLSST